MTKASASTDRSAADPSSFVSAKPTSIENVPVALGPASASQDPLPSASSAPTPVSNVTRTVQAEPQEQAPVSRDVSLHLGEAGSGVDIRMAERAGEIKVTVHTPDRDLADSLRADLPDLVGKLRQNGFQADVWHPSSTAQTESGRRTNPGVPLAQDYTPGDRRDGRHRQSQDQPQQQDKNQSSWAGEWKSNLGLAQES